MASVRTVKVSRERLVAVLRVKSAELAAQAEAEFSAKKAVSIAAAEREVERRKEHLANLKKAKFGEKSGQVVANRIGNEAIEQQIRLLELSDESEIGLGPSSDLLRYI